MPRLMPRPPPVGAVERALFVTLLGCALALLWWRVVSFPPAA